MTSLGLSMIDWGVIVATLLGPILAVQAQKWIERTREKRDQQLKVFYVLMSTRALRGNSAEHIQALNSINLFFSKKSRKERAIVDAWNIYLDHLHDLRENPAAEEISRWTEKSENLLVNLLSELAKFLGYDFDHVQLKKGVYFPRSQNEQLASQAALLDNLNRVLSGQRSLKMDVTAYREEDHSEADMK